MIMNWAHIMHAAWQAYVHSFIHADAVRCTMAADDHRMAGVCFLCSSLRCAAESRLVFLELR